MQAYAGFQFRIELQILPKNGQATLCNCGNGLRKWTAGSKCGAKFGACDEAD